MLVHVLNRNIPLDVHFLRRPAIIVGNRKFRADPLALMVCRS